MRKQVAILLALVLLMSTCVLSGCAKENEPVKVTIFQQKIEIDEALKAAAAAYTETHPGVVITVETSGNNYATTLKTQFTSNKGPTIFQTNGYNDMALWADYLEDLSREEWVQYMPDVAVDTTSIDGKIYGFPVAMEGNGCVYHVDAFSAAGITEIPTTLSEFREVCQKLVEFGYAEGPISNEYSSYYQAGMFIFSMGLALQADPLSFIDGLNGGTATFLGNEPFIQLTKWIDTEIEFGEKPFNTDFVGEVSSFTSGNTAMMFGGSYSQPSLDSVDPEMNVSMFPFCISEDSAKNDVIFASPAPIWHINKDGGEAETAAAKDFLTWLSCTEEGQAYMVKEMKLVPALTNIPVSAEDVGPLGAKLKEYIDANKVLGIYNALYPEGEGSAQLLGDAVCAYAAGQYTVDEFLQAAQDIWTK